MRLATISAFDARCFDLDCFQTLAGGRTNYLTPGPTIPVRAP
jgi:hypothetical protein